MTIYQTKEKPFNEVEIPDDPELIFVPGKMVDIVLEDAVDKLDVYSADILQINHDSQRMLISKTTPPFTKDYKDKQINVSIIYTQGYERRIRVAATCKIIKMAKNAALRGGKVQDVIIIAYQLPFQKINIRSTFRLPLMPYFEIKCILTFHKNEFRSESDFKVHDISASGIAVTIPNSNDASIHMLNQLELETEGVINLVLKQRDVSQPKRVTTTVKWERTTDLNPKRDLIGFSFSNLSPSDESTIVQFLNQMQLSEIRKKNDF